MFGRNCFPWPSRIYGLEAGYEMFWTPKVMDILHINEAHNGYLDMVLDTVLSVFLCSASSWSLPMAAAGSFSDRTPNMAVSPWPFSSRPFSTILLRLPSGGSTSCILFSLASLYRLPQIESSRYFYGAPVEGCWTCLGGGQGEAVRTAGMSGRQQFGIRILPRELRGWRQALKRGLTHIYDEEHTG